MHWAETTTIKLGCTHLSSTLLLQKLQEFTQTPEIEEQPRQCLDTPACVCSKGTVTEHQQILGT